VTAPISDCDAFDLLAELADGGTVDAEHCRMLQDWAQRMCSDIRGAEAAEGGVMCSQPATVRIPVETLAECARWHREQLVKQGLVKPAKEPSR
jgi:hypothetical protein